MSLLKYIISVIYTSVEVMDLCKLRFLYSFYSHRVSFQAANVKWRTPLGESKRLSQYPYPNSDFVKRIKKSQILGSYHGHVLQTNTFSYYEWRRWSTLSKDAHTYMHTHTWDTLQLWPAIPIPIHSLLSQICGRCQHSSTWTNYQTL